MIRTRLDPRTKSIVTLWLATLVTVAAEEFGPLFPRTEGPRYTVEDWRRDWPGCEYEDGVAAGRVSVVSMAGVRWWKVTFAPGRIGPADGGAGWRWPFTTHAWPAAELEYRLFFEPRFQFVKGGKLPGLCGGPRNVTGGRECTGYEGWSVRLMWRREGRGEAYVYHAAKAGEYGDSLPFPDDFRFPCGLPVDVRLSVEMNSPGQTNGRVRVWATDTAGQLRLLVDRGDLLFTKDPAIGVDSILFETFHGGADESWAPTEACSLALTSFRVRSARTPRPPGAEPGGLPALRRR
ncbi:MAG: hypothetical protein N2652_11845 [Kiritimatiellae bacterium]|nr:hypothetical protein [Kiritimatiellia bacterium]